MSEAAATHRTPESPEPATFPGRVRSQWAVTYPLIVGSLSTTALAVVDTAVLGRYGTDALATIALALPIFVLGSALVVPWGTAVQVLVARNLGAARPEGIARLLDVGLIVCVVAAMVPTLAILAAAGPLVDLLADGQAPGQAADAARILACTLPFTAVTAHYRGVFAGLGQTKVTMRVAVGVNLLNIPLDVLLVYGLELGAIGSALGTLSAVLGGAGYVAWLAHRRLRDDYPYGRRARRAGTPGGGAAAADAGAGDLWRLGWPDVTFAVIVYGADVLLVAIVATLGTNDLAAYRLMVTTVAVLWVVVFSCSSGISILAGQRLGAGDEAGALAVMRTGGALMLGLSALIVAGPLLVPEIVFAAFTSDEAVIDAASGAVGVLALLVPAMVIAMSLAGLLRAGGDTVGIMYAGALSQFVLAVPIAWWAVQVAGWGLAGAYVGFATGILARAAFTLVRFRQGRWRGTQESSPDSETT